MRGIGTIFSLIIKKIRQFVVFALTVLLLLLFTRLLLNFFGLSRSQFTYWVFWLSGPLVAPFNNLHAPLPYNGYSIDVSTLVAMLVYIVLAMIVRWFLRILATWPRD